MAILSAADIVAKYFGQKDNLKTLNQGDVLLHQGETNKRLYYVHRGQLSGERIGTYEFTQHFVVGPGELVGIQSFFNNAILSQVTVSADEDTDVSSIEVEDIIDDSPSEVLMPLFIEVMNNRQNRLYESLSSEHEKRMQLEEHERLSQLGQFAAGVAHELNNAVSVIDRGSAWAMEQLENMLSTCPHPREAQLLRGMQDGRSADSRALRKEARAFAERSGLSLSSARKAVLLGLSDTDALALAQDETALDALYTAWETGTTLRDVAAASKHAAAVVESMKNLGARHSLELQALSVKQSLDQSLSILRNVIKGVDIQLSCDTDVSVYGNKGELNQVWINIIKNACDAMRATQAVSHRIQINLDTEADKCVVRIQDNGPGIPVAIQKKIFQPNFTTKKTGLSFGLGIGLSIVKKIINSFDGTIVVESDTDGTCFIVRLPRVVAEEGESL